MPSVLRMIFPVVGKIARCLPRLNLYADHPESFPFDLRYRHTHQFAFSLIPAFRIRFVFKGLENAGDERAVFLFNHQSNVDPVEVMSVLNRPCGYLAKKQICTYPIIDQVMRSTDGNYLDRNDLRQEVKTIRDIASKLKKDPEMGFVIFPEGKRSQDPVHRTMSPYKPGSLKSAYYAKADIVPCVLYGTYSILEFSKPDRKVYPIQITFLPRLRYQDYKDLSTVELSALIEERTRQECERMRRLQPALEEYWNRPENAKEFRRELKARMKAYWKRRRKEIKADKKLAAAYHKDHPFNKDKYRPVVYTAEDARHDREAKAERDEEKKEFLRIARERGEI